MQRLKFFQSLWAMELRRPDGIENSPEEVFQMVADAGFEGMAIDLAARATQIVDSKDLRSRRSFQQTPR